MSKLDSFLGVVARATSRIAVWHRWPFPFADGIIVGLRTNMRERNLHDTEVAPPEPTPQPPDPDDPLNPLDVRGYRTADGSYNDLSAPGMGRANTRFGRNLPLASTYGEKPPTLYEPNPRHVSNTLLARETFVPVGYLNLLVPAWIQFMVHDWLSHGKNDTANPPHRFPVPPGDTKWDGREMTVLRTRPAPPAPGDTGRPTPFLNVESHWWDGSQIYGSNLARQMLVRRDPDTGLPRADGKIHLDRRGFLPDDPEAKQPGQELAGVNGNWWIGLSVLHTLFAREHNAIVDRLRADYPRASGEWLFQKARIVNAALLAKIHTVEWTPSLMNSPSGRLAMRGNYYGLFGEQFKNAYGRLGESEVLSGIPGSPKEHHTAPYAMTEEFTACYRLHSLMPDDFLFRHHKTDAALLEAGLAAVSGNAARAIYRQVDIADVLYTLGTASPGALVLHNYPNSLRRLDKRLDDTVFIDLAAVDILRDRERGVPRYCEFRRLLDMTVPTSFAELTANKTWQKQLAEVYQRVEDVDFLIGTLCETAPPGFGFSDTLFRIFILMASRRLKSDRFFTDDFRPEIYTPAGFRWVHENTMQTVLARHFPELAPAFSGPRNAFFTWTRSKV